MSSARTRATIAILVAALASSGARAAAFELRLLGAMDSLVTTTPTKVDRLNDAELGVTLKTDVIGLANNHLDIHEDLWFRAGLTGLQPPPPAGANPSLISPGNPTSWQLRALSINAKKLGGVVDLTFGRFMTPGGFWLIADGMKVNLHVASWLDATAYGGLRAFTTARRNADLDTSNPVMLPVAGAALVAHHRYVDASLTFTYSQDDVSFAQGGEAVDASGQPIDPRARVVPLLTGGAGVDTLEHHLEDEFFLDGQLSIYPSDHAWLSAGASFGSRYDVALAPADPYAPVTGYITLGAISAYALGEWRPVKRLRLVASVNFERIRVAQTEALVQNPDKTFSAVAAANGSFEDNDLRASFLLWKALRAELEYRLRFRENTDIENKVVAGLRGDDLLAGFGLFASIGLDFNTNAVINGSTKLPNNYNRVLYSAGLSFVKRFIDVRAGVLYTDGIGSGLVFSQYTPPTPSTTGGPATNAPGGLFPYVLDTNRIAFLRLFVNHKQVFGGLDVEENLDTVQLRALLQIGVAR